MKYIYVVSQHSRLANLYIPGGNSAKCPNDDLIVVDRTCVIVTARFKSPFFGLRKIKKVLRCNFNANLAS